MVPNTALGRRLFKMVIETKEILESRIITDRLYKKEIPELRMIIGDLISESRLLVNSVYRKYYGIMETRNDNQNS